MKHGATADPPTHRGVPIHVPLFENASDPARHALEQRWLSLTRERLPQVAAARGWPVTADHCFQRILLDHAVGGCWYDHVTGRPAYRMIEVSRLVEAVALGEAALAGTVDLAALNRQSLAWRADARRARGNVPVPCGHRSERRLSRPLRAG